MKVLIGIRRTTQTIPDVSYSIIEGQSTEIITTGSEEYIKKFVKNIRNLEKDLPSLHKAKFEFDEEGWKDCESDEEIENIGQNLSDKIYVANSLKKYSTVLLIDAEIL